MRRYFFRAAITRRTASSIRSRGIDVGSVGKRMGGAFGPRRGIILFGGLAVPTSLILSPRLLFDMLVCLFCAGKA
jgi:hypothetical protein